MSLSLRTKDIKTIVNEAFDEMAKLGGAAPMGAKPHPMGAPMGAPVGKPQNSNGVKGGTMFHPTCRSAEYVIDDVSKKEYLVCNFDWIPRQYQDRLVAVLNQAFPQICEVSLNPNDKIMQAYNAGKTKDERLMPPPIVFKLTEDKEHEFINAVVPGFAKVLERMSGTANNNMGVGKADMDITAVQNLPTVTKGYIDSAVNAGDQEAANKRMVATWTDMLQNLTDPSVYAKMQQITGVYVSSPSIASNMQQANADNTNIDAGYQLSTFNKMQVYLQLPTATYVTQAWVWEQYWHREVIDTTQFAIIRKPKDNWKFKYLPKQVKDDATRKITKGRFNNYHDFVINVRPDDPQKLAIEFEACKSAPQDWWVSVKVYDIANTRMMKGFENDTTWEDTANFEDNLKGVPNAAYHKKFDSVNGTQVAVPPPVLHNYDENDFYLIDNFLKEKTMDAQKKNNLSVGSGLNTVGSVYDDIIHKAFAYGIANAATANRQSQGRKEAFAKAVAVQIGAVFGLLDKSKLLKKFYDELKYGDDKKETSLKATINLSFPLVSPLIAQINNHVLNDHKKKHSDRRQALAPSATTPAPQVDLDTVDVSTQPSAPAAPQTPQAQAPQATPAVPAPQAPAPQAPASTDNDNQQKGVMEESAVPQWTIEDAYKLFGIDGSDEQPEYMEEEIDDVPSEDTLMESFFRLYDKLEVL